MSLYTSVCNHVKRWLICQGVHYFMCVSIICVYHKMVNMSRSPLFQVFIHECMYHVKLQIVTCVYEE